VPVVHLRLDTASPAVQPAIDSRFVHYAHEDVFFLGPARTVDPQVIEGIRRREPTDDLALFSTPMRAQAGCCSTIRGTHAAGVAKDRRLGWRANRSAEARRVVPTRLRRADG
jgi:hypothetical protein